MLERRIENLNIKVEESLITPNELKELYPLSENVVSTVMNGQSTIWDILNKKDPRLFIIVGPCSIHDTIAARKYADKLRELAEELQDTLILVMRVYFEKPRTNIGWQGLINDPHLDGSCKMEEGLKQARSLLLYIGDIGLPAATEALDQVTPQYVQDLISWTAIGARTTESQNHRKMASGFTSAVGFKNSTSGNIDVAVNAIASASSSQNFVSVNPEGHVAVIRTKGNLNSHIILRGGKKPNYDPETIQYCEDKMKGSGFIPNIVVDCSHANCNKDPYNQLKVMDQISNYVNSGNESICGLMMESNLNAGNQSIPGDLNELKYGVSITDACLDWNTTAEALRKLRTSVKETIQNRFKEKTAI